MQNNEYGIKTKDEIYMRGVYIIQGEITGLVKIGASINFESRFVKIQNESPDALKLIGFIHAAKGEYIYDIERNLHKRLKSDRVHGEWFKPSDDLMQIVKKYKIDGKRVRPSKKAIRFEERDQEMVNRILKLRLDGKSNGCLTYEEISKITGVPKSTVGKVVRRSTRIITPRYD